MRTLIAALAAAIALGSGASAVAAPALFADTGHYYEYVRTDLNFADALAAAHAASFMGRGGYLATITSESENVFAAGVVAASRGGLASTWLGGSDEESEGIWKWVTGPEAGSTFWSFGVTAPGFYAPWHSGEPNNTDGEDGLSGYYFGQLSWNDVCLCSGPPQVTGYLVEYGPGPTGPGVPEPSAWALMILGFGAAGASLRRRRAGLGVRDINCASATSSVRQD